PAAAERGRRGSVRAAAGVPRRGARPAPEVRHGHRRRPVGRGRPHRGHRRVRVGGGEAAAAEVREPRQGLRTAREGAGSGATAPGSGPPGWYSPANPVPWEAEGGAEGPAPVPGGGTQE